MERDSVHTKRDVILGVSFHDGVTTEQRDVTGGVGGLEIFGMGKNDPGFAKAALKVLELPLFTDLHHSEQVGVHGSDHPNDGLFFRFWFSRIGAELAVDPPRHGEIVLQIVGGDS
jgi:hypothetical protein